jgi:WD40 repeat protein
MNAAVAPKAAGKPVATDRQLGVLRYSPCGKFLLGGDFQGHVCRWAASDDRLSPLAPFAGHSGWVQGLALHPSGKLALSADSWGRLCAWPFADEAPRPAWKHDHAHGAWIRRLALSPDGKALASCSADGAVCVWDSATGKRRASWRHGTDVLALTFAPDGRSVLAGDLRGAVVRYDLAGRALQRYDAAEMYKLDRIQDVGGVRCLAFDPAGKVLAAGGGAPTTGGFVQATPLVVFFDAATGQRAQALRVGAVNDGYALDLHWHRAGFVMAVTSGQPGAGKLFFHRPGEAKPFFLAAGMANCHSLAVRPDGKGLVVSATNANSAGNGRLVGKDKSYPSNTSPLHVWRL